MGNLTELQEKEDTLDVFSRLKETIGIIKGNFENWTYHNESSVKQGIVLPILQSLDWNIFDTREVFPEYNLHGTKVDYALCINDIPKILIETKGIDKSQKSEEKLQDEKKQLFEYSRNANVENAILTDGICWYFYLVKDETEECFKINLLRDKFSTICMFFLKYLRKLAEDTNYDWSEEENPDFNKFTVSLYDDLEKITSCDIEFQNEKFYIECKKKKNSWKQVYGEICKMLYKKNSSKMQELIHSPRFGGSSNPSFSDEELTNSIKIADGIYANTYKGANGYTKLLRELMRHFNIRSSDFKVTCIEKGNAIYLENGMSIKIKKKIRP